MLKIMILVFASVVIFCVLCVVGATIVKAASPVVEIDQLRAGELAVKAFELKDKCDIEISAVGAGYKDVKGFFAYGWIINADSREMVWTMQDDCMDINRISPTLAECDQTVKMRPGRYEVYYYVGEPNRMVLIKGIKDLSDVIDWVDNLLSSEDKGEDKFYKDDIDELSFVVKTDGSAKEYTPEFNKPAGSFVYFNQPDKDEYFRQGFTLKDKIELEIYAIGEFADSYEIFVDGGWIVNADTREKVWSMDKWNTDRAGGADKNRFCVDIIALPPGNYVAYYATDDSHDAGQWNAPPPADPKNYGMSIAAVDPADLKYVTPFDDKMNETEIVALTRVRDDALEKAGFTLKKDARVHIVGLGERDYSNDYLVDYGWITDADDMEKVWEMTADNTGYAGGAAKNCIFDGIVDLPAGNYIVHYRTDDSHSYGDWNAAPPNDKSAWGISLYGVGPDFSDKSFSLVDEFEPTGNVLVEMTRLGDDEDVKKSFTLDKASNIRIVALGEGKSNHMYDYGWIENDDNGDIVWEMTYRMTRNAGGADKNRLVVTSISLDKGRYTAHFITDDSHSYDDFNASPPDDPERWGITITKK